MTHNTEALLDFFSSSTGSNLHITWNTSSKRILQQNVLTRTAIEQTLFGTNEKTFFELKEHPQGNESKV